MSITDDQSFYSEYHSSQDSRRNEPEKNSARMDKLIKSITMELAEKQEVDFAQFVGLFPKDIFPSMDDLEVKMAVKLKADFLKKGKLEFYHEGAEIARIDTPCNKVSLILRGAVSVFRREGCNSILKKSSSTIKQTTQRNEESEYVAVKTSSKLLQKSVEVEQKVSNSFSNLRTSREFSTKKPNFQHIATDSSKESLMQRSHSALKGKVGKRFLARAKSQFMTEVKRLRAFEIFGR